MTASYDPEEFGSVLPEHRKRISIQIGKLFDAGDSEREQIIESLVAYITDESALGEDGQAAREYSGLFIDRLIDILGHVKSSHKSPLVDYLTLLNHIPILRLSNWHKS
ncbi:MAG: hypothetical protein U1B83_02485, partial [Candidatus Cloacimonadaceae bacterium]|nr:hypothetical protein [Candidatus Cloacimonadaceae bacterium]